MRYVTIDPRVEAMIIAQFGAWVKDYDCLRYGEGYFTAAALDGETVAGFIAVHPQSWIPPLERVSDAFIEVIEVAENYRRMGVATQLVQMMENSAREYGYRQIRAWSSDDKVEALNMWLKLGYCMCAAAMLGESVKPAQAQIPGYYCAKLLS